MQQRGAAPSFGRKGQGPSDMDARREAFIAAERARRQQEGEHVEPIGSDDLPAFMHAIFQAVKEAQPAMATR